MTLTSDQLTEALHAALKHCEPQCSRFCVAGARLDEGRYVVHHNGTGSLDSDWQTVYAPETLNLAGEALASRLRAWVEALHKRQRFDLNQPGGVA